MAHALAGNAKAQKLLLQVGSINPTWTSGAGKLPRDQLYSVFVDIEGYQLQDDVVVPEYFDGGENRHQVLLLKHADDRPS